MNGAKVLGIVGWSGSGKTTLLTKLIPLLVNRGLRVSTLKHAHHAFDVDQPGKDSYEHRKAGASEVIVSSARRWVQMHEVGEGAEATLAELLSRLSPCNLILIEGFKSERHPKMEVFRPSVGTSRARSSGGTSAYASSKAGALAMTHSLGSSSTSNSAALHSEISGEHPQRGRHRRARARIGQRALLLDAQANGVSHLVVPRGAARKLALRGR
jgi:molybdopterin-guanine dinucleotide biosynthesis protein MobB